LSSSPSAGATPAKATVPAQKGITMYGHPHCSGFGPEPIVSMSALADGLKRRQILRPKARFALILGGETLDVQLLPNGLIEIGHTLPSLARERAIDAALHTMGALLDDAQDSAIGQES
jgi:hypothetical protein